MPTAALPDRLRPRPAEEVYSAALARWGIYARNGRGKTTFLSSIPEDIPTLVVSADAENVKPLRKKANIKVVKAEEWEDLDDVLSTARQFAAYAKQNGRTAALAFDTWSRIQGLCVNFIVGYKLVEPGKEADYMTQAPKLPKGFESWQQIGALMGTWLEYFCRLPLHLIFLMQELDRHPQNEKDILETTPALTPSALVRTMEALELVGRLYVELDNGKGDKIDLSEIEDGANRSINPGAREVRRMLVGYHPRYRCKGDTAALGYVIEDPTFSKLAATLA